MVLFRGFGKLAAGRFVREHDFAGERLRPHGRLAQRVDLPPLLLDLFRQLALNGRGLVEQTRERASLVGPLLG